MSEMENSLLDDSDIFKSTLSEMCSTTFDTRPPVDCIDEVKISETNNDEGNISAEGLENQEKGTVSENSVASVLSVCDKSNEDSTHDSTSDNAETVTDDCTPAVKDEWLDIIGSGDFKKRVIKSGGGIDTRPQHGNLVTVKYICYNSDDVVIEKKDDLQFIIGDLDVIQGLDLAAPLIEKGEIAEILIPSRLAYGKKGRLPDILPDSDLRCIVELLEIDDLSKELPVSKKCEFGNQKRDRGNFWYSREEYINAIHSYERAAEYLDSIYDGSENTPELLQNILDSRIKIYNNMAAAHMKLEAYDPALKSLQFVLKIQPKNVKALFRKGKALAAKGRTTEAIATLKYATGLEPETKVIQQELNRLILKKKAEDENTKAMYKRMFKPISETPKPSKVSSWLKPWSLMAGSCLVVAMGIAAYRQYS